MKITLISLFALMISLNGISQKPQIEYFGRITPSVKKTELKNARFLIDITEELWISLGLQQKDRIQLDKEIDPNKLTVFPPGNYSHVVDYVSVSITATCSGKNMSAESKDDRLTPAQRKILATADLGSEIFLRIQFKFKNQTSNKSESSNIKEGVLSVEVVPELEAEYPGGFAKFSDYLNENLISKVTSKADVDKLLMATLKFTVDDRGQITEASLPRTTSDTRLDKLFIEAVRKMPRWKPAENPKGTKVKQVFTIPFGYGC